MTDQIDALERLAQLRAQGALTEAEFQAEKKKLVNLAAPLSRSDNDGEDDAERALTTIGRWAWIIALAVTAGILMLAWDRFGFGGQGTLAGRRGLVDQAVGAEPQWTRQDETNPINDRRQISAFRREDADGFIIETTISCEPDKAATTYTFTSYAADGSTGAVFRDAGPGNFAEARADDKEPSFFWNMRPTYSNVLEVTVDPGSDFPLANRLLVKLHLAQGEPMITLDQTVRWSHLLGQFGG